MMCWIVWPIFLTLVSTTRAVCIKSYFGEIRAFQCLSLTLQTDKFNIYIECKNLTTFELNLIPDIENNNNSSALHILRCPVFQSISLKDLQTKLKMGPIITLHLNEITLLPDDIFINISTLNSLDLQNNNLKTINRNLLKSLNGLETLLLDYNLISQIEPKAFEDLKNLSYLSLSHNKLKSINKDLFKTLKNLQTLELSLNRLSELHPNAFDELTSLKHLSITGNQLTTFQINLPKLVKLNLWRNNIKVIKENQFEHLTELRELDLGENQISTIEFSAFGGLNNLRKLGLSYNKLASIQLQDIGYISSRFTSSNTTFKTSQKYEYPKFFDSKGIPLNLSLDCVVCSQEKLWIDLSNNKITQVFDNSTIQKTLPVSITLDTNFICDCHTYTLLRKLKNSTYTSLYYKFFEFMTRDPICINYPTQRLLNLDLDNLPCRLPQSLGCPSECKCSFNRVTEMVNIDCSNKNLTNVPVIDIEETLFERLIRVEHKYDVKVNLENNNLVTGSTEGYGYDRVTEMNLSRNRVKSLEWVPPNIKILNIDYNNIEALDIKVIHSLAGSGTLEKLTLSNNPWKCDCDAVPLRNLLLYLHTKVNATEVICHDIDQALIFVPDLCQHHCSFATRNASQLPSGD